MPDRDRSPEFRRRHLSDDRHIAVLDAVARESGWGRILPDGWAQGVGFHVVVADGGTEPGGAGELGVPAAVGAVANAYARATGDTPASFPVRFDIDFEPVPR